MNMAYEVDRALSFEEDLNAAASYLIEELGSPQSASSLFDEVEHAIEVLEEMPFIHAVSKRLNLREWAYREYPVKNYVIIYRVEGDKVYFLRLFHQTQLYERFVSDWS